MTSQTIVSINSTSEEVRSPSAPKVEQPDALFPLIQLPRKSEGLAGLIYLASKRRFPLIQLPRKSEVVIL